MVYVGLLTAAREELEKAKYEVNISVVMRCVAPSNRVDSW